MTVGLSKTWTSDLSFEISDLLIYSCTLWRDSGFPWLVVQAAARPRLDAAAGGHAIQYVTRRRSTGVSRSYILAYSSVMTYRPIRERAK